MRRRWARRRRSGFTYLELLIAVIVLGMISAGVLATWSLSTRIPANQRVTHVSSLVGVHELERLKAQTYLGIPDTGDTPLVRYYDRNGVDVGDSPAAGGFKVKVWVRPWMDRDRVLNLEDLREITVEVWGSDERSARLYTRLNTLITFGGT